MGFSTDARALLESEISALAAEGDRWCRRPGRDFTRARKLPFGKVVYMLVSMGSDSLGTEVARAFGYAADSPRAPAFCRAREKVRPEALLALMVAVNGHLTLGDYRGMVPVACDGSTVALPRDALEATTLVPPDRSSPRGRNAVHATALYDVQSKRYLDAVVQPERGKNEFAAFCEMADRWPYDAVPLYVNDRGIASFNVYAHAIEAGAFFAVRVDDRKASRILGRDVSKEGALDEGASLILTRSQSKRRRLQPDREADYRFIDAQTSFDYIDAEHPEYAIDLRVVRFPLPGGEFENIVTNLPAERFPPDEIRDIYWMRWGIETSFRDLKHAVGAAAPHSSRLPFAAQELYARMVLYNLCTAVAERLAASAARCANGGRRHECRLNLAFLIKAVHDLLRADQRAGPPPEIEALAARSLLPVRPGRRCERRMRFRVPPAFSYRFS